MLNMEQDINLESFFVQLKNTRTIKLSLLLKIYLLYEKCDRCGSAPAVFIYNKHNTTWKVLCTVLRHPSFMYQISHSFAALTRLIYDTSTTRV